LPLPDANDQLPHSGSLWSAFASLMNLVNLPLPDANDQLPHSGSLWSAFASLMNLVNLPLPDTNDQSSLPGDDGTICHRYRVL
jgi:hypothetical protein